MRAKRQSAAVVAAVVSLVVGLLLSRFRRAGRDARRSDRARRPRILAAPDSGAEPGSSDLPSRRVLISRVEDNFATGYQTVTAIIQGVALVALVTTSAHAIFGSASSSHVTTAASQAVAVLVIIIFTTDQFFQLAATTRWLPSTIDTAIPYLLGIGEATAALSLGDNTRWWGAISWSLFAGAIAFGNSATRATPEGFEGIEEYHRRFVRDVRRSRDISAALCAYAIALAVTSALAHPPQWLYVAAPWVVTSSAILRVTQVRWGGLSADDS